MRLPCVRARALLPPSSAAAARSVVRAAALPQLPQLPQLPRCRRRSSSSSASAGAAASPASAPALSESAFSAVADAWLSALEEAFAAAAEQSPAARAAAESGDWEAALASGVLTVKLGPRGACARSRAASVRAPPRRAQQCHPPRSRAHAGFLFAPRRRNVRA